MQLAHHAHLKPILYSCELKMMRNDEHTIHAMVATSPVSRLRNAALLEFARFLPGELAMAAATSSLPCDRAACCLWRCSRSLVYLSGC